MKPAIPLTVLAFVLVASSPVSFAAGQGGQARGRGGDAGALDRGRTSHRRRRAVAQPGGRRAGRVRVVGHSLADDDGPFLGLGVSYFTALWRCKHDRPRLEADLAFLSRQGFNYYRMLSMVGHHPAWEGREIAPVSFTNRDGKRVEAWPDYWQQLRDLIDLAYDRYGMRTQITIFADAQLMPDKEARIEHMRKLLADVVPGREHKIILLEVANEAWQNGFPGDEGVADLREFAKYLGDRTEIPVAITSNHDWPELGSRRGSTRFMPAGRRTWRPGISAGTVAPTTGGSRFTTAGSSPTGPGSRPSAATSRSGRAPRSTRRRSRSGS